MSLQIGLPNSDKCYGCGACSNICPKHCIEMITNEYGERKPRVDLTNCIACGRCMQVCPALYAPDLQKPQKIWSLTIRDDAKRKGSASGGAARLLYEQALSQGATVYGCDFDEQHILRMQSAQTLDEIEGFRNSKYTYCRMENTYRDIKERLAQGEKILFIGTSCQVDAVLRYVGEENKNLVTVDLICHGIPPENYFFEYIHNQEKRMGVKIDRIIFRGDQKNRDYYIQLFHEANLLYDKYARADLYFAGYVNYIMFEEKCYTCPYATYERIADITIGDWWGTALNQEKKLSLLFANTKKGLQYAQSILNEDLLYEEHTLQEAIDSNEQLRGAFQRPIKYESMREIYRSSGFLVMAEKYVRPHILEYEKKIRNEKIRRIMHLPIRIVKKAMRVVKHI